MNTQKPSTPGSVAVRAGENRVSSVVPCTWGRSHKIEYRFNMRQSWWSARSAQLQDGGQRVEGLLLATRTSRGIGPSTGGHMDRRWPDVQAVHREMVNTNSTNLAASAGISAVGCVIERDRSSDRWLCFRRSEPLFRFLAASVPSAVPRDEVVGSMPTGGSTASP